MRWNHKGHRIVYTSQSLSLAVLELWVHIPPVEPLTSYVSVAAQIPDDLRVSVFEREALPPDWQHDPPRVSLRDLGTRWLVSKASAAARVPSVLVPTECNYLLNPEHPDFGRIQMAALLHSCLIVACGSPARCSESPAPVRATIT